MAAKVSVLGLKLSSSPYLRSAKARFSKCHMGDGCSGAMMGMLGLDVSNNYLESDRNFAAYVLSS